MPVLGIRDFSKTVSRSLETVIDTGEPLVLTKRGRPVAVVVPIDDERLEDFVLAHVPSFTAGMAAADDELRRGATTPLIDALDEIAREEMQDEGPEAATADAPSHERGVR